MKSPVVEITFSVVGAEEKFSHRFTRLTQILRKIFLTCFYLLWFYLVFVCANLWQKKIFAFSARWYRYAVYFFLITLSHPILDAFTNGGLGIGLFISLDAHRRFAPFRPIEVSPIGIKRFVDGSAFSVLSSEIVWVWLPLSAVNLVKVSVKKLFDKS